MKYIDADKLIAEIERLLEKAKNDEEKAFVKKDAAGHLAAVTKTTVCVKIKKLITSLQQEPRFPKYDNIVDKVFGAGNLEGFEYREAEMLVALAKEELLKSLQQEQPEVDLEEYIENEVKHHGLSLYEASYGTFSASQIDRIIRNAFELGLNAKKEE